MKRAGCVLLAMALSSTPYPIFAQDEKSPDLQQQKHQENTPPAGANQPNATTGRPSADKSPDTQQDQAGTASKAKSKKRKKSKNDGRQAHGTPEPAPSK
jgi:hypothetical protein